MAKFTLLGDDVIQEGLWALAQSETNVNVQSNIGSYLLYDIYLTTNQHP